MKKSTIEQLKNKKRLPKYITEQILEHGFITGSWLFGCWTEQSDIDIVLPVDFEFDFYEIVQMGGIYEKSYFHINDDDYFYTIYVNLFDRKNIYNLLLMRTQKAYDMWYNATKLMFRLIEKDIKFGTLMQNKENRVKAFEMFKLLQ